jgi:hypothetical protein
MLRLLEMQKQLIAPLTEQLNKAGQKADVQITSLNQIEEAFAESKDSFAYNLEMTENPQLPGGSLLKVIEDFNSNNDPNAFSKSEEKILSKRLFGNERYKLIQDNKLSVNLLSDADKKHLSGDNVLIKAITNKDTLSKLNLNIGEAALITINNVVYKVTSKGVTSPYDVVSSLGLDKKEIKKQLSSFISEYNNEMNNWLGYDKTTGEYLPFTGKPSQIYQIETYYEKEMFKVLENNKKPTYGITDVITVFSDNKSNLNLKEIGINVIDEVNTDGFISKVSTMRNKYNPNIVVVFDDGDSSIQATINLIVNGNEYKTAERVTNAESGLFVIDTNKNIEDQIQELKNFFIANNLTNVYNKVMIVKSINNKSDYNKIIKNALINPLQSVGLSKNFSDYTVITDIVNRLRKLGYLVKPRDILLKGTIDVLPSLLTKSEDGRELYTYILQNADKIKTESDIYNRSITTLSDEVKSQLKATIRRSSVTNSLPHNMKHQEPDRNGLSMSKMRDDLVNQNIKTTFDAILAKLRTQTTRKFKDASALKVGEIVRVTTYGRAPIYVKITNISDTSVGENLAKDYAKLGIKYDPNNIKAEDLERSQYAKEWSKKQGWDISYMMFNMDSLKDKYDIDFEYIPDIEEYAKETDQVIVINKFGWSIDDKFGYDKYKALNANGFIGYTDINSKGSIVNTYIRNTSSQGIPMNDNLVPNSSSIVFVAVPGNDTMSKTVKDKILKKAIEVLEAGGTLLMSNLTRANNEFNKDGEGVILKELYDRFNNLTNSNMLNYTKYSLPNFEKDLETDGQVDQDCK